MSKNTRQLPATEIVEQSIQITRVETTNDESRTWGAMNAEYLLALPFKEDWSFQLASSALVATAKYITGTASVNTGATAVTFSSDVTLPATIVGNARIKFNDNPNVYAITVRDNTTACTISPPLSEDRNVVSGAYTISFPFYSLAADFNRFPKNGGLTFWQGGKPTPIPEKAIQTHYADQTTSPSRPSYCRLMAPDTAGNARVELVPGPDKAYVFPYDYLYVPPPLRETTGGTATIAANGTTVAFHGVTTIAEASTGWFFRIDAFGVGADSEWYPVLALSAAASSATLQTAFGVSGATSANYTLSAAPQLPLVLHQALLQGTVKRLLTDQNDSAFVVADSLQTAAINDAKRLYKSRIYGQDIDMVMEDYQYRR